MTELTFRLSRCTWFVKTHFSDALSSIRTENVSETRFQMPKLDHANAPNLSGWQPSKWNRIWINQRTVCEILPKTPAAIGFPEYNDFNDMAVFCYLEFWWKVNLMVFWCVRIALSHRVGSKFYIFRFSYDPLYQLMTPSCTRPWSIRQT